MATRLNRLPFVVAALFAIFAIYLFCVRSSPESTARHFMEALKSGDETALRATLTRQAQEQTARKLDLRSNDRLEFTVAQAESHGDLAEVPVSVYRAGEREEMTLRMRRDSGEWRIYALGIRPSPGAPEVTLDLEHPDVELSAAFREVGEGVGAALRGVGQGVGALLKDVAAGVREIRSAAAGH